MLRSSAIALLLIIAGTTQAMHVDNFVLLDQHGDAHELYYHKRAPAVVIMVQANSCSSVHDALSDYQALRETFEPQGVKFFMLNSNVEDQRDSIATEAANHGIDVPILHDDSQLIGESLSLTQAG